MDGASGGDSGGRGAADMRRRGCRVVPPSPYPPYSPVFPRLGLGLIMTADVVVSHCRNPAIFVRF